MYTPSIQDGGAAYPYLSYWGAITCSTSWVQMLMLICMQIHKSSRGVSCSQGGAEGCHADIFHFNLSEIKAERHRTIYAMMQ